jgi:hypothetical protein
MKATNLALRFFLELVALAALGYWGGTTGYGVAARIALAIALPLAAAMFWGTFVAPRARVILSTGVRMALGFAVFACAAIGLAHRGHLMLATAYIMAAALNVILMLVWKQDRTIALRSA